MRNCLWDTFSSVELFFICFQMFADCLTTVWVGEGGRPVCVRNCLREHVQSRIRAELFAGYLSDCLGMFSDCLRTVCELFGDSLGVMDCLRTVWGLFGDVGLFAEYLVTV